MEIQQVPKIIQIIDIAGRRKALIASCILTALTVGLGVYFSQPKVFQSDSLLSYQQQMVNTGRMLPDDNSHLKDVVSTLTQIVTSRTSLEKIIKDENLFAKERQQLPIEDVIEGMRSNISINPSKNGDTFRVIYMESNPAKVARVANALAARFIEENMKYREERASETSAYTKEELEMAKKMLDSKEAVMRDFKLKYYNEMPDQRETNMSRLIALQNNYQGRQESIQNLERTRALMRDQIATRKELLAAKNENFIAGGNDSPQLLSRQDKLERLRNELQSLEMRYTEKHPKIKSLKNNIAKLEQSDLDEPEAKPTTAKTEDSANQQVDEILINLEQQLKDISYSIAKITKEKEDIQVLISQYDKWVSVTPVREAEWSALTREYGELKRHYDFLMGQNLQAGSALNLERKQRGSQFKIEDFAQQPLKPVKPDFLKIMGIALLMGCGASVVGCFLLEKMDTSFRFPEQLEATFPFEVLCSVPRLPLKREIVRQRVWIAFGTMFFLTWGLGIIIALGLLWKQGRIII
jgi:polysaccharide chain length determinant protein (PEP-CTERM system associated)